MTRRTRLIFSRERQLQVKTPAEILQQFRADAVKILGGGILLVVVALLVWG